MTDQIIDRRSPPPKSECKHEGLLAGLVHDRDSMKQTLEGVSTKLDLILAQITKVAILEERHTNSAADINRAHLYIVNLEKEVKAMNSEVKDFMSQAKGMGRMAWAVWTLLASGLGVMLVKILFYLPHA
jgi:hypothetical protein